MAFDQEAVAGGTGTQPVRPVRLVIISDTHGFEQSMTNRSAIARHAQSLAKCKDGGIGHALLAATDDDADDHDADDDADDDPAASADADADAAADAATADATTAAPPDAALPEGDVLIHCGDFAPGPIWPNGNRILNLTIYPVPNPNPNPNPTPNPNPNRNPNQASPCDPTRRR